MTFQHTRKILAALAMAGAALALAAPASADHKVTIEAQGQVRGPVPQAARMEGSQMARPGNPNGDPVPIIGADGIVRPADMAVRKTWSPMATPQVHDVELGAIGQSWRSICGPAETSGKRTGSERCRDATR